MGEGLGAGGHAIRRDLYKHSAAGFCSCLDSFKRRKTSGRRCVPMRHARGGQSVVGCPDNASSTRFDPTCMVRPCLQENVHRVGGCAVLHQCIRPLIGAFALRAIMGISARAISLADRPQRAIWVTSIRTRREDRSSISFRILSQTSAGKVFRLLALNHAA
jgi:hypothetical protein